MKKIINSLYQSIFLRSYKLYRRFKYRKNKICPGIFQDINQVNIKFLVFHLDCIISCRLGDTFFYIDGIINIAKHNLNVIVFYHENNYWLLKKYLSPFGNISLIPKSNTNKKIDKFLSIIPIGNKTPFNEKNFLMIDIHKYDYQGNVHEFITYAFNNLLNYILKKYNNGYVIISTDLGSQKFMNSRDKVKKLITYSKNYSLINDLDYYILSSSIKNHKSIKISSSNQLDILKMIDDINCKAVFTFDSFTMHYSLSINKPTFVIFRGKYKKFDYYGHFNKINNAFSNKLIYI